MKKILILMLAVVMVLALSVSLFSCGGDGNTECTAHTDANSDGKCDNCSADMPDAPGEEVTLTTHAEFVAANAGDDDDDDDDLF